MTAIESKKVRAWPLKVEPIADGSVDVWGVSLKTMERRLEALSAILTPGEIRKAKSYRFDRHRRRFCMARGMLRALLGEYLACAPGDVPLVHGAEGKPALDEMLRIPLQFNVSHSRDMVLYTFCSGVQVGTDIEFLDSRLDRDLVANRAFSRAERECYYTAGPGQSLQMFFRLWARKEARLKARGVHMGHIGDETLTRLPVMDLTFEEGYVGAVAVYTPSFRSIPARPAWM